VTAAAPARPRAWRRRAGAALTAALVAASAVGLLQAGRGAWKLEPILSGSMQPALGTGSLALSTRVPTAAVRTGDILVFRPVDQPSRRIAHRIIALRRDGTDVLVRTQGDANNAPDVAEQRLHTAEVHIVRGALPLAGYPAVYLRGRGVRMLVLTAATLMLLYALFPVRPHPAREG
jgi:signal peptidase I